MMLLLCSRQTARRPCGQLVDGARRVAQRCQARKLHLHMLCCLCLCCHRRRRCARGCFCCSLFGCEARNEPCVPFVAWYRCSGVAIDLAPPARNHCVVEHASDGIDTATVTGPATDSPSDVTVAKCRLLKAPRAHRDCTQRKQVAHCVVVEVGGAPGAHLGTYLILELGQHAGRPRRPPAPRRRRHRRHQSRCRRRNYCCSGDQG